MKYLIVPIICVFIAYSIQTKVMVEEGMVATAPEEIQVLTPLESTAYAEKPKAKVEATPAPKIINVSSDKNSIMAMAGISTSDYGYVDYIINRESTWRHLAVNKTSGATGLCQALPASKMASAGSDYLTNPVTQLRWCDSYAKARYGGWAQAYNFWKAKHWW